MLMLLRNSVRTPTRHCHLSIGSFGSKVNASTPDLVRSLVSMATDGATAMRELIARNDREHGVQEVRIPVPYGTLAGKWWGPRDTRPILCLHGYLDNSGTFDRLIPLLPAHISFLALDLPGNGHSSRHPHGMAYHLSDVIHLLLHVMNDQGWTKVSFMSHSMGTAFQYMFAALFPEKVDFLISLDAIKVPVANVHTMFSDLRKLMPNFVKVDQRNQRNAEPPALSYDQLIEQQIETSLRSITPEVCPYLLYRNVSESTKEIGKFFFHRDDRWKHVVRHICPQELSELMAEKIMAPFLFIKASDAPYFEAKQCHDKIVAVLEKNNPKFVQKQVTGQHYAHLTHPERVAPLVVDFLSTYWEKDTVRASKL